MSCNTLVGRVLGDGTGVGDPTVQFSCIVKSLKWVMMFHHLWCCGTFTDLSEAPAVNTFGGGTYNGLKEFGPSR